MTLGLNESCGSEQPAGSEFITKSSKKSKRKRDRVAGEPGIRNEDAAVGEHGVKQEYSNGLPGGSELGAKSSKKKTRKRDGVADESDVSNEDAAMVEHVVNQEYPNGLPGGSELGAKSSKKKKRNRDGVADESDVANEDAVAGEHVVKQEYLNDLPGGSDLDAKSSKKNKRKRDRVAGEPGIRNEDAAMGEHGVKQEYSNGLPGGSELGAKSSKKKTRKRDGVADESDVSNEDATMGKHVVKQEYSNGLRGDSEVGAKSSKKKKRKRDGVADESDVAYENAAAGEHVVKQEYLNGLPGGSELRAKSITEKKRKRDGVADESDVAYENAAAGEHVVKQEYLNGLPGGSELRAKSITEKKRKRDRVADESDIANGDAAILGFDSQTDNMAKKKEKSKTKKIVRFQEPTTPDFHEENVTYMPREYDSEDDMAWLYEDRSWEKDIVREGLRYGRFAEKEDQKIKDGVFKYMKMRGWGEDEGVQMVLHSSEYAEARGCWLEIAKCLPIRPVKQIYERAIRLLAGFTQGTWSADETETLKNLHDRHGSDWKKIASHMNRSGQLCKDKWRKLRMLPILKRGSWTQDEMDRLCKLVRRSLRLRASLPAKKLDRRQHIRDDLNWDWIGEEMQRYSSNCAGTWYERMASAMIRARKWANGDDHLLLQRLIELGATSEEVVDWDVILDHRDGECCMKRWKEMTRLLGKSDHIPFEDKVELLTKRYAPDLLGIEES